MIFTLFSDASGSFLLAQCMRKSDSSGHCLPHLTKTYQENFIYCFVLFIQHFVWFHTINLYELMFKQILALFEHYFFCSSFVISCAVILLWFLVKVRSVGILNTSICLEHCFGISLLPGCPALMLDHLQWWLNLSQTQNSKRIPAFLLIVIKLVCVWFCEMTKHTV